VSDSTPPASSSFELVKALLRELLSFVEEVERMGSLIRLRPDLAPEWNLPAQIALIAGGEGVDLRQFVSDPDQTEPVITIFSGAVPGIAVNGGIITAGSAVAADTYTITLRAQDLANNKTNASVDIVVSPAVVNSAPFWQGLPSTIAIIPPAVVKLSDYGRDPDPSDELRYTIFAGAIPSPATFNGITGDITFPLGFPSGNLVGLQFGLDDQKGGFTPSASITIAVGGKPVWIGPPSFSLEAGQSQDLAVWFTASEPFSVALSPLSASLPPGMTIEQGVLKAAAGSASASGAGIILRATAQSGQISDSPAITLSVVAPLVGDLQVIAEPYFKYDPIKPVKGVFWNNNQKTIRDEIIGMNDGDHGYEHAGANTVRLYNYAGLDYQSRHGVIPTGEMGYLQKPYIAEGVPDPTETGRYVHEEDNYWNWYVPPVDKLLWLCSGGPSAGASTGTWGIFDCKPWTGSSGSQWEYGNSTRSANWWQGGPYWGSYVDTSLWTVTGAANKNSPNTWIEAADRGIAINQDTTRMFVIERNPNWPTSSSKPYRVAAPVISTRPWRIQVGEDRRNTVGGDTQQQWYLNPPKLWGSGHNQFINCGVAVGFWMYFIQPATGGPNSPPDDPATSTKESDFPTSYIPGDRDTFPPLTIDGDTYPGYKGRAFWRIFGEPPYDRWQRLANFPEFEVVPSDGSGNNSWGPSLFPDEDANGIWCVYKEFWFYDIEADKWSRKTPPGWLRIYNSVGALFRMPSGERHLVYQGGANIDRASGTNPATGQPWHKHWSRLRLIGGLAPRGSYAPLTKFMPYLGSPVADNPFGGKHRRLIEMDEWVDADTGQLVRPSTVAPTSEGLKAPIIGCFGGDYHGVPYSNSAKVAGYPWEVETRQDTTFDGSGNPEQVRTSSGSIVPSTINYYGYVVMEDIVGGDVVIRASSSSTSIVYDTIPAGTKAGTRVSRTFGNSGGAYAFFPPGAAGKVRAIIASPRIAAANQQTSGWYFAYEVLISPSAPIHLRHAQTNDQNEANIIWTIPAGTPVGTKTEKALPPTFYANGLYLDYKGEGCVRLWVGGASDVDSNRWDQWQASVDMLAGEHIVELLSNQCPYYPYLPNADGSWPMPSLDQVTQMPSRKHPDGVGVVRDKRGEHWIGPGYFRFDGATWPPSHSTHDRGMWRWRRPNRVNNAANSQVHNVRKGNAWFRPPTQSDYPGGVTDWGGSNAWTCYDPIEDVVIAPTQITEGAAGGGRQIKFRLRKFNVNPASPQYLQWTDESFIRPVSEWDTVMGRVLGNGVFFTAACCVVRENLYFVCTVGAGGGYSTSKFAFLNRMNLRNASDYEYIKLPTHWCRGHDAPLGPNFWASSIDSPNEGNDIWALGHLVVLGTPAINYEPDTDPWCCYYDTNRRKWTVGQTYSQMRAARPSLPLLNDSAYARGKGTVVKHTGEYWYFLGSPAGVVKYRIF